MISTCEGLTSCASRTFQDHRGDQKNVFDGILYPWIYPTIFQLKQMRFYQNLKHFDTILKMQCDKVRKGSKSGSGYGLGVHIQGGPNPLRHAPVSQPM